MKSKIVLLFFALASFGFAQTLSSPFSLGITKNTNTNLLNTDFGVGSGLTITYFSGANFKMFSGANFNVSGSATSSLDGVPIGTTTPSSVIATSLSVKSGTNGLGGTATLSAGSAIISSTAIDTNTVISYSRITPSGTASPLIIDVAPGVATISGNINDNGTYKWAALKVN